MNVPSLRALPVPLVVACLLTGLQGLLFVGYALLELINLSTDRLALAVTTTLFFAWYGVGLLACARAMLRRQTWGRSPVVFAQLLHLMVAWSFRGGETTLVAVVVAVVSVLVLVGIFVPPSLRALATDDDAER